MQSRCSFALFIYATLMLCFPSQGMAQDGSAQPPDTASIQQQMIDLQKAFVNAQELGDAEYVKNTLADDFISIETNGDSSGKDELVHDVHLPERPGPSPILYDFKIVELDRGCAVVTYQAVFPGSHMERYQHLSDTWVKQDGKWKLKFQQTTLDLWSAHDLD